MKKCLSLFFLLCLLWMAAPGAFAQETSGPLPISVSRDGQNLGALTDDSRTTRATLEAGQSLQIHSDTPLQGLYLIWEKPAPCTLVGEDGSTQAHDTGFLHDYLSLEGLTDFSLLLPEGGQLCEVYGFGDGELPDWVQRWQPPCEQADLLLMPTHADDEHLWFGGAMPYYAAERGLEVQVAYLISHWDQPPRPHELLDGLWTVGVTRYPVISDFPDYYADNLAAAQSLYNEEEILAWQVEQLRRFRPAVAVGHDLEGEYGHGVHCLNAKCLLQAVEDAADPTLFPESAQRYGSWDTPKLYLHLYPENTIVMDWENIFLESFGGKSAIEVAREGFACHVSQQGVFHVTGAGGWYDCRLFGLARSLVGPDLTGNDFFENVSIPSQQPSPTPSPTPSPSLTPSPSPTPEPSPPDSGQGGPLLWAAGAGLIILLLAVFFFFRKRRKKPDTRRIYRAK